MRSGRWSRRLLIGAVALIAVAVLLLGATLIHVRSAQQQTSGSMAVAGLRQEVRVLRDELGVPHVRAASLEDAVFAQGFLHAGDRLWQMELVRRAVQGRLAEVLGEQGVETDRFMRRLGLWRSTAAAMDRLTAEEERIMAAYAAGVNAALDNWSGALPPEFLVLRHRPEPWTPRDILAVGRMMSFTLSSYSEAAAVASAMRRLGADRARHLFPEFPDWGTTILPTPEPADAPPLAAALIDAYSIATASNSWVVSGELSRSGRPMLANDPHLGLQAPSLWYLVGLHAEDEGVHVVGASIPGAPMVILGHNRAIAWGMTNAYVDDADIFVERVDPAEPGRYLTPDGWRPFEAVQETIRVKGQEEPEILEVRRTRHGPVLPLAGDAPDSTLLAAQWTALGPGTVVRGILGLNRASDWESFVQAVDDLDDPHQNFVYADTAGHIGYIMGGTVPLRGERRPAPVAPVPGWTGQWDWSGTLPFDEHPRALDPERGFIVTANNRQTVEPLAELISGSWQDPFRAMRITEMLAGGGWTAADMLAMQMDVEDVFARRYLPLAIDAATAAGLDESASTLRDWDTRAEPGSTAATLFYTWAATLRRAAARDLYQGEPGFFPRNSLVEVLERRSLPWRQDGADAYRQLAEAAIQEAVELGKGRPWREGNRVVHAHPLGGVTILDRLLGLNVGPAPHYGSPTTVNVAHYAFRSPADDFPFTTTAGPSMRHVVDMGNLEEAGGFVIGTGQSGLPFSRHYDDQTELWREGELWPLPLDPDAVERRAEQTLILEPLRRE